MSWSAELTEALGRANVITDPARLRTYECDGLTGYRVQPAMVVLPRSAAEVAAAVRVCARHGVPFVARGAGTGLSGGALPVADGIVISLQKLRRVVEVDPVNLRAVVEPGVTNLDISRAAAPYGLYYAPDPSSQQVCTIGGNVAENSGGAHCLKYGFTVNHVLAAEVVLADGTVTTLGGDSAQLPGYDLLGAFIGSEGTLGIVTQVTVRLLAKPAAVRTMVADFATVAGAGDAVTGIIAAVSSPRRSRCSTTSPSRPSPRPPRASTRPTPSPRWWSSWTARPTTSPSSSTRSSRSAASTAARRSWWPPTPSSGR